MNVDMKSAKSISPGCRRAAHGFILIVLLAVLINGQPLPMSASTNVVDVYPTNFQHKIGDNLAGVGVVYSWESDAGWANGASRSNLVDMGAAFIRYPGGEVADYFHWENPNGSGWADTWSPTWNPANALEGTNWMSVDEYVGHIDAVGAQPLLGINVDSGCVYPERLQEAITEATNFVHYAMINGYAVKYWCIGNESYHSSDRSPAGAGQPMMTVTQYADYINLYANAMRAVDPSIKIVANWNSTWSSQYTTLLNLAGTNIDMLDLHCYWNWGNATWSNWISQLPMQFGSSSYQGTIQQFRTNLDKLGYTNTQIGMLEYNLGPPPTDANGYVNPPSRYQVGLANSEILLQSVEGGLDAGCFYVLDRLPADLAKKVPTPLFNTNAARTPFPAFYPLKWFGAVSGQNSVRSSETWTGTFTTAALNPTENVLTTFILRKASSSALIELNSHGFGAQNVQVETFQAPGGDITLGSNEIVNTPYTNVANGNVQFTAPAWSLTRVMLTKPSCHIETGIITTNGVNCSTWHTATFANAFQRPPVVVCGPLSANNAEPALMRVRNVTTTNFQYRVAEWDYQDNVHVAEMFQWLAVPEGVTDINGQKWEAGLMTAQGPWFKANRFKHKFDHPPLLFYQVYQLTKSTVTPRSRNVQADRFELRLVEERTNAVPHGFEQVGYLAVPANTKGTLPDGRKYVALSTGNAVGNNWTQIDFNTTLTNHCFIAAMQSAIEDDYGCALRYTNFTGALVKLKVDEENSTGTNTLAHSPENVGILALGYDVQPALNTNGTQTNVWIGGQSGNSWDYLATNWLNGGELSAYSEASAVIFDDIGSTNPTVNILATVLPASVLVNSTGNYTFSGTGKITGTNTLIKSGTGVLTLTLGNDYSGGTEINAGGVKLGSTSNGLLGTGPVTINPGGYLWVTGISPAPLANDLTIAGSGVNGAGAIYVNGKPLTVSNVTLSADAVIGTDANTASLFTATGTVDVGTNTLTVASGVSNAYQYVYFNGNVAGSGVLALSASSLGASYARLYLNNATTFSGEATLSARSGATGGARIVLAHTNALQNATLNTGIWAPETTTYFMAPGGVPYTCNLGGLSGADDLNITTNSISVGANGRDTVFSGAITGTGGLSKTGNGALTLSGVNTYSGGTTVSSGRLALVSSAVATSLISNTPNIFVNAGATLDVSGVASGFCLLPGQVLSGSGSIAGFLLAGSNAIVAPGPSLATLTFSNSPTLQGGLLMKINRTNAPLNGDRLVVTGQPLTNGGVLTVTNIGPALQAGDSFTLLSASAISGSFTAVNLPSLPLGLIWNTASLATSGAISVVLQATNLTWSASGNQLTLNWPADHLGWILQSQSNDLNRGLYTNWVNVAGSDSVTQSVITVNPSNPAVFFRLRSP
jgi:alpha-L-arabinofuranosidase